MTWLAPAAGAARDQLTALIDRLAEALDGPRFQPHLTVLVTFEAAQGVAAGTLTSLVAGVPPVNLASTAIGYEETYFRCLDLQAAPSAQLQALQEAGQRAFTLDRLPPAPHLSLLYADLAGDRKRRIVDTLGIRLPLTVCFDAVELWAQDPRGVASWSRAARVPLRGAPTA